MTTIEMLRNAAAAAEKAKKAAAVSWVDTVVLPALYADAARGNNAAKHVELSVPVEFYEGHGLFYINYCLQQSHGLYCHFSDYADTVIIYWR